MILETLGVKYHEYEMPKAYIGTTSAFYMQDNMVYLYPPNDGAPTKPIYFYDDGRLIFRNENAFQEITNLDEILLEMIQIYNKALDEKVSINSYGFMLELQDKLTPFYNGRAIQLTQVWNQIYVIYNPYCNGRLTGVERYDLALTLQSLLLYLSWLPFQ